MKRHPVSALLLLLPATILLGASIWLMAYSPNGHKSTFYLAQVTLASSLLLLYIFHSRVIKPLKSIANGMNLLREQDFSSRLRHVGQADADRIVDMFNDMMQHLRHERLHIREQNHFLDLLINSSPMGIIVLDRNGLVSMLNGAAATFLNITRENATGMHPADMHGPLAEAITGLKQGTTSTLRLSNSMIYRCSRLSYMDQGFAHPFILIERLTDEVMLAERTAYEKVIRMMSHEVNNSMAGVGSLLGTISGCIEDPDVAEALESCRRRCMTMCAFITSFANVVKIPQASPETTDLNAFILNCRTLLESLCSGRAIDLHIIQATRPALASVDTVLMEQVLINLIKNAAESIGQGGNITIRIDSCPPRFTVEDNGPGIDSATQAKIFTPFFSSKASGRGLGLLFVCDVLNKHRCTFSLLTYPDGITRFAVEFPPIS